MSGIVGNNTNRGSGLVKSSAVGADSIDGSNIADDAIDSEHYTDGSIDNAHIADDAIDSEHYADGSIDNAHIADDAIDSEHYADGSIDNAHIADDAIDSEHYAAGRIDEAHIADNAVSLAKMAGNTDGVIITFDASGDPVAVGPGSDGEVLTSTGAGSPPAFEAVAAGGGLTLISAQTASTSSTIAFTGLDTYDTFLITAGGVVTSDDNATIHVQMGTGGTPTWVTSGAYGGCAAIAYAGGEENFGYSNTNGAQMTGPINAVGSIVGFSVYIYSLLDASITTCSNTSAYIDGGSDQYTGAAGGGLVSQSTTAGTALRLAPSAGTFTIGEFKLYGLKAS